MKIVFANKYFFFKGGAERYFFDYIELMERHGHTVIPFAMQHPNNRPTPYDKYFVSEVDYHGSNSFWGKLKIAARFIYSREAKRKFEQLVIAEKPDVVHVQNIYHQLSPSILDVCRKYKIPVVQTVQDYHLICPNYRLFCRGAIEQWCLKGRYYKEVVHRCVQDSYTASALAALEMYFNKTLRIYERTVRVWIVISKKMVDLLVEHGMPRDRMKMLYHFLDVRAIKPHYSIGSYLLCYGRLSDEKGFDIVITAMQWIKGLKLHIVGEGAMEGQLREMVERLGLSDRVTFFGFLRGKELQDQIDGSALVVVPSIWHEPFGYTVVESMAAGKVVVGSRAGAITELVGAVDKRLIFDIGNPDDLALKVNWLLAHRREMGVMARKGRAFVERELDPERYYGELMKIYKKVMKKSSKT